MNKTISFPNVTTSYVHTSTPLNFQPRIPEQEQLCMFFCVFLNLLYINFFIDSFESEDHNTRQSPVSGQYTPCLHPYNYNGISCLLHIWRITCQHQELLPLWQCTQIWNWLTTLYFWNNFVYILLQLFFFPFIFIVFTWSLYLYIMSFWGLNCLIKKQDIFQAVGVHLFLTKLLDIIQTSILTVWFKIIFLITKKSIKISSWIIHHYHCWKTFASACVSTTTKKSK